MFSFGWESNHMLLICMIKLKLKLNNTNMAAVVAKIKVS